MRFNEPDLERPYIEQGKYEMAVEQLHARMYNEVWQDFTDELAIEDAIDRLDPHDMLRDIIQRVAKGTVDKSNPLETYKAIFDTVEAFVAKVTERRVTSHMEAL